MGSRQAICQQHLVQTIQFQSLLKKNQAVSMLLKKILTILGSRRARHGWKPRAQVSTGLTILDVPFLNAPVKINSRTDWLASLAWCSSDWCASTLRRPEYSWTCANEIDIFLLTTCNVSVRTDKPIESLYSLPS